MNKDVKRVLSLSLFLVILGILCAGLLAFVNHITEPIIEQNKIKELEAKLAVINIKDPQIYECELLQGVDAVYTGVYNQGLEDETECFVFQVTVKNSYTTITSIIAMEKGTGKIVALAPMSGDPSYTTHGKNKEFENSDFGLIGANQGNYNVKYEEVAGATVSSSSVQEGVKFAYEQFEIINERQYIHDGTYLAYKLSVNKNAPEIIFATVIILNDQLVDVEIDTIQGTNTNGEVKFNELSKRQLGYSYGLHYYTYAPEVGFENATQEGYVEWLRQNKKYEWFEQMDIIEDIILYNGIDQISITDSKYQNISGVSVSDYGYIELVEEALKYARQGVVQAFTTTEDDVVVTKANIDFSGNLSNVYLDVYEGNYTDETFNWKEKSKQEAEYEYGMHYYTYAPEVGFENATQQGYIEWLKTNERLEWFEQANIIAEEWEKNHEFSSNNGSFKDVISSVTIADGKFIETLNKLNTYKNQISNYACDGKYVAYKLSVNKNAPEIIFVTVTISNGVIADIEIDTIQGTNNEGDAKFNELSKRRLGYNYGLHYYTYAPEVGFENATQEGYIEWLRLNEKYEWFEQMDIVEEQIMNGGLISINLNGESKYESISGVSVTDYGYLDLVREAIYYAKIGFKQSFTVSNKEVVVATANVAKDGTLSNVFLDVYEGESGIESFVWNEKSKQEKKYEYGMHYYTYAGQVGYENATQQGYIEWLKANNKLEWFEQANLIAEEWEKNHEFSSNNGYFKDEISSVTIADGKFIETLNKLIDEAE